MIVIHLIEIFKFKFNYFLFKYLYFFSLIRDAEKAVLILKTLGGIKTSTEPNLFYFKFHKYF